MKVLLISHSYPPHVSPRAIRWSAILETWAEGGHEPHVICAAGPGSPRHEVLRGVHVHRVGASPFAAWRARFARHSAPPAGALAASSAGDGPGIRVSRGARLARRVYDALWPSIYWPDFACVWYPAARARAVAMCREIGFEWLITSSLPFTDHLVGLRLRRERSAMTWLADSGDPFSFMDLTPLNNRRLYARLNQRVERRVFQQADAATVTTDRTAAIYATLFPEAAHKISVVPPLMTPAVVPAFASAHASDGARRLVFVGTLYRSIRSPAGLLAVFTQLLLRDPRLQLHFYGALHDATEHFQPYEHLIDKSIFVHGMVSRAEALNAQRAAHALINIGNETPYQLPSKVVEYAATGKPIVNFARSSADSSVEFLARYPASLSVIQPTDVATPKAVDDVSRFLDHPPAVPPDVVDRLLAPFRADRVAARYEELLHDAARGRRRQPAGT